MVVGVTMIKVVLGQEKKSISRAPQDRGSERCFPHLWKI
jgi:hypothetical protein